MVGYGPQFWNVSQEERDAAAQAKQQEFDEWELANPALLASKLHGPAARARYESMLSAARLQVEQMGMDAAAEAARGQVQDETIGGVRMTMHPFEQCNGIYATVDVTDNWPRFRSVATNDWLFFQPISCEWVIARDYGDQGVDAQGQQMRGKASVPCDGGKLPLRAQPWMSVKKPRSPQTIVLLALGLVTPAEVDEARQKVAADRNQAQAAVREQIEGAAAVIVTDSQPELNGRYTVAADYDGWPDFTSSSGMHLFRHLPAEAWRISPNLDPKPVPSLTAQVINKDGTIPTDELPSWFVLEGSHWHAVRLTVSIE